MHRRDWRFVTIVLATITALIQHPSSSIAGDVKSVQEHNDHGRHLKHRLKGLKILRDGAIIEAFKTPEIVVTCTEGYAELGGKTRLPQGDPVKAGYPTVRH